ncbi:MAG: response regulator [Nocardioides sp.]
MDRDVVNRVIVNASRDGVLLLDRAGDLLWANDKADEILGLDPGAADDGGLRFADLLDEARRPWLARRLAELSADPHDHEVILHPPGREPVWSWVRVSPAVEDGRAIGLVVRISTATERTPLIEALRIARIGGWRLDVDSGLISGSAELMALFEADYRSFPMTVAEFVSQLHPDDRAMAAENLERLVDGSVSRATVDVRLADPRRVSWIRIRAVAHRDADGRVYEVVGTDQDISEVKARELSLSESNTVNSILHNVASAANRATTLYDVLAFSRTALVGHSDWTAVYFLQGDASGQLVLLGEGIDGDPVPTDALIDVALRALTVQGVVWSDDRSTVASLVFDDGQPAGVLVLVPAPPIRQPDLVELVAEQVALQFGRVAERERTRVELAVARDAALSASAQKSRFLAVMSHEVRTPLNGVIGLGELLLQSRLTAAQRGLVLGVQRAGRSLLALVNDTLDLSKLEAGKITIEQIEFDVRELVETTAALLAPEAQAKGVGLDVHVSATVPPVLRGDPTRLGQILTNLLGNAVKFTSEGEVSVDVAAVPHGDRVELGIAVADSGPGIPPDRVAALFEPFEQGDTSTTRIYGGTGLGLTISRELIGAMGGELHHASPSGGGSVFSFSVVLEVGGDVDAAAGTRTEEPARPRVLVAEDNEVNQLVAVGILEGLGCEVTVVADGLEAVGAVDGRRFDLIFMDVQMPRMDGYAATRRLRAEGGTPPIIALTASATDDVRAECLAAGMDDFLTKPLDRDALTAAIERWTGIRLSPRVDLRRLTMLAGFDDGAPEFLRRAIDRFAGNAEEALRQLRQLADAGDRAGLRAEAHRLLGSALNLGLDASAALLREIEDAAQRADDTAAHVALAKLEHELRHDVEELRAHRE